jgi:hypothetical protein
LSQQVTFWHTAAELTVMALAAYNISAARAGNTLARLG